MGRRLAGDAQYADATEEAGKTTLTCTVLYPTKEARDAVLTTGMKDGVSLSFDRLAEHLRTMT